MSEYRNVSTGVKPLASGRLVAPGGTADLEPLEGSKTLEPHDQALIDEGAFVPVDNTKNPTPKKEA